MAQGLRYQHRQDCTLITPYGEVILDADGVVVNLGEFNPADLLTIDGFVDAEIFGDVPRRPRRVDLDQDSRNQADQQGPTDIDYWGVIKELTLKGGRLNTEGYLQMEVLTAELRDRGWPPISGTRRIRITDEGREREKQGDSDAPPNDAGTTLESP